MSVISLSKKRAYAVSYYNTNSNFRCENMYLEKYLYSYYIDREVYIIKLENMFHSVNVTFRNYR